MSGKYYSYLLLMLIIIFYSLSCNSDQRRAAYIPSEKDSLEFLVNHSDLIAVVEIFNGLPHDYGGNNKSRLLEVAQVKIKEKIKSEDQSFDKISISYEPVHSDPNAFKTLLALRNGEYIAFLKKQKSTYKPLTAYSLIEIDFNIGRPIWKQTKSKFIDIPDIPKDEIINEIKEKVSP